MRGAVFGLGRRELSDERGGSGRPEALTKAEKPGVCFWLLHERKRNRGFEKVYNSDCLTFGKTCKSNKDLLTSSELRTTKGRAFVELGRGLNAALRREHMSQGLKRPGRWVASFCWCFTFYGVVEMYLDTQPGGFVHDRSDACDFQPYTKDNIQRNTKKLPTSLKTSTK